MVCKRILFIVDTPEGLSRQLADKVAGLARSFAAEVEVFAAVFDPMLVDAGMVQEAIARRREELDGIVARLRDEGVPAHSTACWAYPPRLGIFRRIRRYRPDLIVIRSRRHSRLARLLFTYSDYKLIESAPCPVLVIKNDHSYADCRVVAAIDPALEHAKPAVLDERIVEMGAAVAESLGRPLHLYHACSPWPVGDVSPKKLRDLPASVIEDVAGAWQAKVQASVSALAHRAKVPDARVHLVAGHAAATLPEFVAQSPSDLLVMGAVSRSPLKKAFIGHTAEKVLEETDCDVLIVRLPRSRRLKQARQTVES